MVGIYKITNKLNGKSYIGVHKTKNPNDDYIGSGKLISRAIKKYGRDSFIKEVLYVYDNPKDMFLKERELVTEVFVKDESNYNCKPGGHANWYYVNEHGLNHKNDQHLVLRDRIKNDDTFAKEFSQKMSKASSWRSFNANMSKEERSAAGKRAAAARWNKRSGDGKVT